MSKSVHKYEKSIPELSGACKGEVLGDFNRLPGRIGARLNGGGKSRVAWGGGATEADAALPEGCSTRGVPLEDAFAATD